MSLTFEELHQGLKDALAIAVEIGPSKPAAAEIIMDAVELGLRKVALHLTRGDRALAEKLHREMMGRRSD